jgi:hypothetical protein
VDTEAVLAVVDGKEAADLEEADTEAVLAAAVVGKEVAVVRLHILYIIWLIIAMCSCIISVVDRACRVFCFVTQS